MHLRAFLSSVEVLLGTGLFVAGVCLRLSGGAHDVLSLALAPFGGGLILSEGLCRAAKSARGQK